MITQADVEAWDARVKWALARWRWWISVQFVSTSILVAAVFSLLFQHHWPIFYSVYLTLEVTGLVLGAVAIVNSYRWRRKTHTIMNALDEKIEADRVQRLKEIVGDR